MHVVTRKKNGELGFWCANGLKGIVQMQFASASFVCQREEIVICEKPTEAFD
jgi:hypothetical protein